MLSDSVHYNVCDRDTYKKPVFSTAIGNDIVEYMIWVFISAGTQPYALVIHSDIPDLRKYYLHISREVALQYRLLRQLRGDVEIVLFDS